MPPTRKVVVDHLPRTWTYDYVHLSELFAHRYKQDASRSLGRTMATLQLSPAKIGSLFDVSRQAINLWLDRGIPTDRIASVRRVDDLVARLSHTFKPERLPEIVQTRLPGLGNRTIIEAIGSGHIADVYAMLDRLTSWIPAA
jgi:hypothetical protein